MSDFTSESTEALEKLLEEAFEITLRAEEKENNGDNGLHKQDKERDGA